MPSAATILRSQLRLGHAPVARLAAAMAGLSLLASAAVAGVSVGVCARLEPRSAGDVRAIGPSDTLPPAHRVLGVLTTETSGPSGLRQPTFDYWAARFRAPAARLGADAVAGIQWVHVPDRGRYFATALALSTAPAGDSAPCERVVALASTVNRCEGPADLRAADEEILRVATTCALGRRGYYLSAETASPAGPEGFGAPAGLRAGLRLAIEIEPGGERAVAEGGPVRLRATLTDAAGAERWKASELEAFQDLADIAGAVAFGTLKSRSGHLLSAVERLARSLPVPAAEPAARASAP